MTARERIFDMNLATHLNSFHSFEKKGLPSVKRKIGIFERLQ